MIEPTGGMLPPGRAEPGPSQAAVERRQLLAEDIPAIVARAGAQWDLFQAGLGGAE